MADKTEKTYVVKALAVLANIEGSFATLLHRGAAVPAGVEPSHLKHLLDNDLVVEGEPAGGLAPVFPANAPVEPSATDKAAAQKDADAQAKADKEAADKAAADEKAKADADAAAKAKAAGAKS